jgi:hypothetical protein
MACVLLVTAVVGLLLTVLVLSMSFIGRGMQLRLDPPRRRWAGSLLIVAGLLLPVACCCGPSVAFRLHYGLPPLGRDPNGVIKEGMTGDEARALLGAPHNINEQHPERVYWHYWLDAILLNYFRVYFGPDGKVEWAQGD